MKTSTKHFGLAVGP